MGCCKGYLYYLCSVENGTQLGFLEDYGYSNPDELSTSAPERAVYDFRQVFPGFIENEVVQFYPDKRRRLMLTRTWVFQ